MWNSEVSSLNCAWYYAELFPWKVFFAIYYNALQNWKQWQHLWNQAPSPKGMSALPTQLNTPRRRETEHHSSIGMLKNIQISTLGIFTILHAIKFRQSLTWQRRRVYFPYLIIQTLNFLYLFVGYIFENCENWISGWSVQVITDCCPL